MAHLIVMPRHPRARERRAVRSHKQGRAAYAFQREGVEYRLIRLTRDQPATLIRRVVQRAPRLLVRCAHADADCHELPLPSRTRILQALHDLPALKRAFIADVVAIAVTTTTVASTCKASFSAEASTVAEAARVSAREPVRQVRGRHGARDAERAAGRARAGIR